MDNSANTGHPAQEAVGSTHSTGDATQSPASPTIPPANRKEKGRVRFNSTAGTAPPGPSSPLSGYEPRNESAMPIPQLPRPSVLRGNSYNSVASEPDDADNIADDPDSEKVRQAFAAQERAQHVAASLIGSFSAPGSRRTSVDSEAETISSSGGFLQSSSPGIPLNNLNLGINEHQTGDGRHGHGRELPFEEHRALKKAAYELVRSHSRKDKPDAHLPHVPAGDPGTVTRPSTPVEEQGFAEHYVPPPTQYRGGVLSNLLKLYKSPEPVERRKSEISEYSTPGDSGVSTPTRRKWYEQNKSQDTLSNLVEASVRLGALAGTPGTRSSLVSNQTSGAGTPEKFGRPKRPKHKRTSSNRLLAFSRNRMDDEIKITVHIAETLSRQKYIIRLCRALMLFGAPTHRLEEYLKMTARVLEIDSQFLYLPGCMIISFDDRSTHTTEVKIVR